MSSRRRNQLLACESRGNCCVGLLVMLCQKPRSFNLKECALATIPRQFDDIRHTVEFDGSVEGSMAIDNVEAYSCAELWERGIYQGSSTITPMRSSPLSG